MRVGSPLMINQSLPAERTVQPDDASAAPGLVPQVPVAVITGSSGASDKLQVKPFARPCPLCVCMCVCVCTVL